MSIPLELPTFDTMPRTIPVFPLSGALLMPQGQLPLNIFEPRYVAMVQDAMAGDRVIGMIQPKSDTESSEKPNLYEVGCTGKISEHRETNDGRTLIVLTGVCRFKIIEELPAITRYRQILASYAQFRPDFHISKEPNFPRKKLESSLERYFSHKAIEADWEAIKDAPDDALVSALVMMAPFSSAEKQALIEAVTQTEQGHILSSLMDMLVLESQQAGPGGDPSPNGARH